MNESDLRNMHMTVAALLSITTAVLEVLGPDIEPTRRKELLAALEARRSGALDRYRQIPGWGSLEMFDGTVDMFEKLLKTSSD